MNMYFRKNNERNTFFGRERGSFEFWKREEVLRMF